MIAKLLQAGGYLLALSIVLSLAFRERKRIRLKTIVEENRNAFMREMARMGKNPKDFHFNRWGPPLKLRISAAEEKYGKDDSIRSLQKLIVEYAAAINLIEKEVHHKVIGHDQVHVI